MTKQLSPLRRKDQATGYAKAVREIVAWLRKEDEYLLSSDNEFKEFLADQIEEDFGTPNVAD